MPIWRRFSKPGLSWLAQDFFVNSATIVRPLTRRSVAAYCSIAIAAVAVPLAFQVPQRVFENTAPYP
jgi:hypothetical protein